MSETKIISGRDIASRVPPPLPAFERLPLKEFLKPGLPATPRDTLSRAMRENLKDYEQLIREKRQAGIIPPNSLAVCEPSRAFGKKYSPNMIVNATPCLTTQLRYLFVISCDDIGKEDGQRKFFRWLMPYERLSLQGVAPEVALLMRTSNIVHAAGNAYPIPLVAACLSPALKAIQACFLELDPWHERAPVVESGLPNVRAFFMRHLTVAKTKTECFGKKSIKTNTKTTKFIMKKKRWSKEDNEESDLSQQDRRD